MAENCFICSETFKDPVSLSCNHSFCFSCLQKFWEQTKNKNCPICKRKTKETNSKELVPVVFTQRTVSSSKRQSGKRSAEDTREKTETKVVVCDEHSDVPYLFCKDEQRAVCPVCEFSLHQNHKVVPVDQAVHELKEQLRTVLKSLQDKKKTHQHVEKTYTDVVQHSKKQLLSTERQIRDQFKKLHQFLRDEEESRLQALREEEEQKGRTISREMKRIQEQMSSLSDSISAVEEDLQKDNMSFLSTYEDTQTRARNQNSLVDPQLVSGTLVDVAKHLGNLAFRVWDKMKDQVHFSPVILDPNTAAPSLSLSEDLTSVRQGDTKQKLPDNPERNARFADVFGSEGFSSGRHHWDVEVGDHPGWTVGVVKESVDRKGHCPPTPTSGIWCLLHHGGKYSTGAGHPVPVKRTLQRIRVQLDYNSGEVSFYTSEDMSHIYTYRDTITETLFPYFSVGPAGDAQTSEIKVCPVGHTV